MLLFVQSIAIFAQEGRTDGKLYGHLKSDNIMSVVHSNKKDEYEKYGILYKNETQTQLTDDFHDMII